MKPEAVEFARFVAVRASVAHVAELFRPLGIPVAPLKGALILVGYTREPRVRSIGDVDLLVPSNRFGDARDALVRAGARELVPDTEGRAFTCALPGASFVVDLQHRLCRDGLYRIDEVAMLARSRSDQDAFGANVRILQPEDAYAHAIAHHAGGRPLGPADRLAGDLELLESRVDPQTLAARIREFGLVRALAFVRLDLARRDHARPALDELSARIGTTSVDLAAARAALALVGPRLPRAIDSFARHLTNESALAAARSAASHLTSTAKHRLR